MKSKFYKVTCKCGHVGKKWFIRISFPVNAESGKEAAKIAKGIPRVKHDHKDAILSCVKIDYEEYQILEVINENDPYLKCSNKQEQELIAELSTRLEPEPRFENSPRFNKRNNVEYRFKKQKYIEDLNEDYRVYLGGAFYGEFAY